MADTRSSTTQAPAPGKTVVELLIAVGGSLLGTWVAGVFDDSPESRLVGAVLGALVPPLLTEIIPQKTTTRPLVALGVAIGAIALTYSGLTARDFATESSPTFPLPRGVPSPVGTTTESRGGLEIEVSPASLKCSKDACAEPVTVENVGDRPLEVRVIEVDGKNAADFTADADQTCANRWLQPGDGCSFDVTFKPSKGKGVKQARLVIHQNLPGDPTYVPLSGEGDDTDPPNGNNGNNGSTGSTYTNEPNGDPVVNLKLSADNVECRYQRSGTAEGEDALQLSVAIDLDKGKVDDLPGLVRVSARSNRGIAGSVSSAVGSGVTTVAIPLRSTDYGKTHTVTVTVDPAEAIPETDEDDNRVALQMAIPKQPAASVSTLPIDCTPA